MAPGPHSNTGYDPTDHLNKLFVNHVSIRRIPDLLQHIHTHRQSLVAEISQQSQLDDADTKVLNQAQTAPAKVAELFVELQSLQKQAQTTEMAISSMTLDIKKLHDTKTNLVQSVTVLKRLQMLTTAYDQLTLLVKRKQYREMVQTLPAVLELAAHFKPFRTVTPIAQLGNRAMDLIPRIKLQIMQDFQVAVQARTSPNTATSRTAESPVSLNFACQVLDLLPHEPGQPSARDELVSWYCDARLKEYRTIFRPTDEAGSLDNMSRRYLYLRRFYLNHTSEWTAYFPSGWNVDFEFAQQMVHVTASDIQTLLRPSTNLSLLLAALQETLDFEAEIQKSHPSLEISKSFQPYLHIWIDNQEQVLRARIDKYRAPVRGSETTPTTPTAPSPTTTTTTKEHLPSATDLVLLYRQLLTQAIKLSTGEPLLQFSKVLGHWLVVYADHVLKPLVPGQGANSTKVSESDLEPLAVCLNTADYLNNTVQQLQDRLVQTIDSEFKSRVSLQPAGTRFLEQVSFCISGFVAHVESALDHPYREMANVNWARLDSVKDTSSYIQGMVSAISGRCEQIFSRVYKDAHIMLICNKVAECISSRFLSTLLRCSPLPEIAAEQMLLDHTILKEYLLRLPAICDSSKPIPTSFTGLFNRSLSPIELLLKVILTKSQPAEGLVQNYLYIIKDKSPTNFVRLLEIKGVDRSEHAHLVEMFNSYLKAHEDLQDSSPVFAYIRQSESPVSPTLRERAASPDASVGKAINDNFRRLFRREGR